jgi:hypothetical protein
MVIYESIELSQFDMFKAGNSKLRVLAGSRLGEIKMSHRLMDGGLLYNIENQSRKIRLIMIMGTEGAAGWSAFSQVRIQETYSQILMFRY